MIYDLICILFRSLQDVLVPDVVSCISGEVGVSLSTIACSPKRKVVYECLLRGNVPKTARGRVLGIESGLVLQLLMFFVC